MPKENTKPKVLIVGAGLGGLCLGTILERAGIPYEIFEKASALKPLGSAISLGPSVMPMFTQLGLIDEIRAKGRTLKEAFVFNEHFEVVTYFDYYTGMVERFGWPLQIIARPLLHNMLLHFVPKEKIHLGKRVLSYVETGDGVNIRTSDGKTHHGNILVGADGAHSGVRQSMYEQLDKKGKLPASDKKPLKYSHVCLLGQTRPLTEAEFEHVEGENCRVESVIGDKRPHICITLTTAENTVCWMVVQSLDKESSKVHDNFRASEWGAEAAEAMCSEVRDFRIRRETTIGDLIDVTPKDEICKVMMEEKSFETWVYDRTVLLGDACHKMAPNAGLGVQSAMLDAVVLANHINTLNSNELKDVKRVLKAYRDERYPTGKVAVETSASMVNVIKNNVTGNLYRKFIHTMPRWLFYMVQARTYSNRPQISFLPRVEDKGSRLHTFQPSLGGHTSSMSVAK